VLKAFYKNELQSALFSLQVCFYIVLLHVRLMIIIVVELFNHLKLIMLFTFI